MKKQLIKLILVIFCGAMIQFSFATSANHQPMDRIVVTVNDTVITQSELTKAMNTLKKQMEASQMTLPPDAEIRKQVLDQLTNRKLQLQVAETANISASDQEIDQAITQIAQQNRMSPAEIYQKLGSQGMTKAEYRKELKEEIILQKIQGQEVASKITISAQEIDDFMRSKSWQASTNKEYHLEDILIGLPDEPTSEQIVDAKKRATAILDKIHHGMKFSEAAMLESNSNSTLKGGDLGWRKLPEIPTAFADQVIHMKDKQIIGPLQTQNGFHLIYLAGVRKIDAHGDTVSQRKQVEQLIFQRKLEEGLQTWILKLRSAATINLNPEG